MQVRPSLAVPFGAAELELLRPCCDHASGLVSAAQGMAI